MRSCLVRFFYLRLKSILYRAKPQVIMKQRHWYPNKFLWPGWKDLSKNNIFILTKFQNCSDYWGFLCSITVKTLLLPFFFFFFLLLNTYSLLPLSIPKVFLVAKFHFHFSFLNFKMYLHAFCQDIALFLDEQINFIFYFIGTSIVVLRLYDLQHQQERYLGQDPSTAPCVMVQEADRMVKYMYV